MSGGSSVSSSKHTSTLTAALESPLRPARRVIVRAAARVRIIREQRLNERRSGSFACRIRAIQSMMTDAKQDSSPFHYTHACLHVPPAEDAGRPYRGLRGADGCGLSSDERSAFVRDGFVVLPGAVPRELIDAARSHVATARSNSWEQLRRLRSDDWRMHFQQRFSDGAELVDGHAPVLDLLCAAPRVHGALRDLSAADGCPIGSFYTQVAFRTPLPSGGRAGPASMTGGHTTWMASEAAGEQFPDHFSVLVGVALSDQCEPGVRLHRLPRRTRLAFVARVPGAYATGRCEAARAACHEEARPR